MSIPPTSSAQQAEPLLPTGTVTFLFTDIEGSTPLWEQHPQAMAAALEVHNQALRSAFEAHGGVIFKVVGDAFQAAFPTASQALLAAIEGQRRLETADWNELGPLKVRMGLHTGEAELDHDVGIRGGEEYAVSHAKNRAARVMSAGHAGQILLSQETAVLVVRQTGEGVFLKDLGEHHLKGMRLPEHLFQVVAPGLQEDFPSLASQAEIPNNLPAQLTSFIGREALIEQIVQVCLDNRLVSLLGTGGVGKTRCSLQVADRLLPSFSEGVWWVGLAPVTNPERIPQAVADALKLRLTGGDALEDLVERLRARHMLLVLDNCEHLIDACAGVTAALLQGCPKLHVLATSREALNVPGEIVQRVPVLSLPPDGEIGTHANDRLEDFAQVESIRLLLARAQEAAPGLVLTDADIPSLVRICRRLDGIPLGLELAAARLRVLSPAQVAERLDDRFHLLAGGRRTALPHHQTLRAAIDWSYQLLEPKEQLLFWRLSIFSGGWTLEAAEGICSGELAPRDSATRNDRVVLELYEVLDLLTSLVDKSLLQVEQAPGKPARYYLLETLRQYGREKLLESGEAAALHRRHREWYVGWVEAGLPNQKNENLVAWMDALEADFDDLRAALEWADMDHVGSETALRLSSALYRYWWIRGNFEEAIRWLRKGLVVPAQELEQLAAEQPDLVLRIARAWHCLYWVISVSNSDEAVKALDHSIACYQYLGSLGEPGLVEVLAWRGTLVLPHGETEAALEYNAQAIELGRSLGEGGRWELAMALWISSTLSLQMNDLDTAQARALESWSLFQQVGDHWNAGPVTVLGVVDMLRGSLETSQKYFEQALARYRESGDNGGTGYIYYNLSNLMLIQKDYSKAIQLYREGVRFWQMQGNHYQVAQYFKTMIFFRLHYLFQNSFELNDSEVADFVQLFSYAESRDAAYKTPLTAAQFMDWWFKFGERVRRVDLLALSESNFRSFGDRLQAKLDGFGAAGFYQAVIAGQGLSFNQALEKISGK